MAEVKEKCDFFEKILCDRVRTEVFSFAGSTMLANPDIIELVHRLLNDFRKIGQNACFEITFVLVFHANSCTREVCTADIHLSAVKYNNFKVNTRTKHSLQTIVQHREFVEVLAEVRARLFCMNQPHRHATPNELGNESQKWPLLLAHFYIQIFDVGSSNPKRVLHGLHP